MTTQLLVIEDPKDWIFAEEGYRLLDLDSYLTEGRFMRQRGVQVINLCRRYSYLSSGYYCSLLAEARGHRAVPSVRTALELTQRSVKDLPVGAVERAATRSLDEVVGPEAAAATIQVFFGMSCDERLNRLARKAFEAFPCPFMQIRFKRVGGVWRFDSVKPLTLQRLVKEQHSCARAALDAYLRRPPRRRKPPAPAAYDLAILHDPHERQPPSDGAALKRFMSVGRAMGIQVDLITHRDLGRLAEYDALFIRETTHINHPSYRFAKKAEAEGVVVIDDPQSILRCTNKVYLAELLRAGQVPTPRSVIAGNADLEAAEHQIGYPMVMKVPDGAFSRGVHRAGDRDGMREIAKRLFKLTELILIQEYLYTEYDWRIGVLDGRALYAAKYFMSSDHWQIVRYNASGAPVEGAWETCDLAAVPPQVIKAALRAANLVGDGLYGVDIKLHGGRAFVIEVNDNPSIERGVEDAVLGRELYKRILYSFVQRIELNRTRGLRRLDNGDNIEPASIRAPAVMTMDESGR